MWAVKIVMVILVLSAVLSAIRGNVMAYSLFTAAGLVIHFSRDIDW